MRRLSRKLGLRLTQRELLIGLVQPPPGRSRGWYNPKTGLVWCPRRRLAKQLGVDKSTITRAAAALRRRGVLQLELPATRRSAPLYSIPSIGPACAAEIAKFRGAFFAENAPNLLELVPQYQTASARAARGTSTPEHDREKPSDPLTLTGGRYQAAPAEKVAEYRTVIAIVHEWFRRSAPDAPPSIRAVTDGAAAIAAAQGWTCYPHDLSRAVAWVISTRRALARETRLPRAAPVLSQATRKCPHVDDCGTNWHYCNSRDLTDKPRKPGAPAAGRWFEDDDENPATSAAQRRPTPIYAAIERRPGDLHDPPAAGAQNGAGMVEVESG